MKPYLKSYNEKAEKIKLSAKEHVDKAVDKMYLRQFYFTIANLKNLNPDSLIGSTYEETYERLLYLRALTPLDANHYAERIDECTIKGGVNEVINNPNEAKIFCVYHTGSYRAIMGYLAMLGYDFSLVIDKNVYDNQGESIKEVVEKVNTAYDVKSDFDLINAEDFDAAMRMVKRIREGKSLVLYIDGNTGTGGVFRHDEKLEEIDFFNKKLFARQGIAYISFLTNTPIVPVASYRERMEEDQIGLDNVVLEFLPKIDPALVKSKKEYCLNTTQALYHCLEDLLRKYPLQWEGWLYVHKYLNENKLKEKEEINRVVEPSLLSSDDLLFNEEKYGLFTFGKQYFLFDNTSYQTYVIGKEEFILLKKFWLKLKLRGNLTVTINEEVLMRLLSMKVLISKPQFHLN